jgi:hypothetical protein
LQVRSGKAPIPLGTFGDRRQERIDRHQDGLVSLYR